MFLELANAKAAFDLHLAGGVSDPAEILLCGIMLPTNLSAFFLAAAGNEKPSDTNIKCVVFDVFE